VGSAYDTHLDGKKPEAYLTISRGSHVPGCWQVPRASQISGTLVNMTSGGRKEVIGPLARKARQGYSTNPDSRHSVKH
jgi:hypothetical protein